MKNKKRSTLVIYCASFVLTFSARIRRAEYKNPGPKLWKWQSRTEIIINPINIINIKIFDMLFDIKNNFIVSYL